MSFTLTVATQVQGAGNPVTSSKSYSGDGALSLDLTVPAGSGDQVISAAIDVSQVKAIIIQSDTAISLKTNSAGAPDNTLALAAGYPYKWTTDSVGALALTVDVTSLHVAKAAGDIALKLECVFDSTI